MEGVFGTVPNPFTTIKTLIGSNAEVSWKERTGEISALVSNSLTESTFRIWPLRRVTSFTSTRTQGQKSLRR